MEIAIGEGVPYIKNPDVQIQAINQLLLLSFGHYLVPVSLLINTCKVFSPKKNLLIH